MLRMQKPIREKLHWKEESVCLQYRPSGQEFSNKGRHTNTEKIIRLKFKKAIVCKNYFYKRKRLQAVLFVSKVWQGLAQLLAR